MPGHSLRSPGAVGDFEVRTVVPRGDIVVGEDAVAYVIVEGEGFLGEDIMPEYRAAFGTGIRLKSVSPSRKSYMAEGKMMSRITIECTFIPETRDHCEIGPVFLNFSTRNRDPTYRRNPVRCR